MKRAISTILIFTLALCMAFSFTACKNDVPQGDESFNEGSSNSIDESLENYENSEISEPENQAPKLYADAVAKFKEQQEMDRKMEACKQRVKEKMGKPLTKEEEKAGKQSEHSTDPCQHFRNEDTGLAQQLRQQQNAKQPRGKFHHAGCHGNDRIAHSLQRRAEHKEQIQKRQADTHHQKILIGNRQGGGNLLRCT